MNMTHAVVFGVLGGLLGGISLAMLNIPTQHLFVPFARSTSIVGFIIVVMGIGVYLLRPLLGASEGTLRTVTELCKMAALLGLGAGLTCGVAAAVAPMAGSPRSRAARRRKPK